jgi:polysaccharide export outer membrane protein
MVMLILPQFCAEAAQDTSAIGPGDRVKVTVLGADDMAADCIVSLSGSINMPVVGSCRVAGQTPDEAAAQLKAAVAKYVKEPNVRVEILQKAASLVVISGRVKKPGPYGVGSKTTLLELLGVAGGEDTNADLETVSIVHSDGKPADTVNLRSFIEGKSLTSNPTLTNGDIVVIPEKVTTVGAVFVLGEVKRVGSYELRPGMRIHEAIASAGGITEEADPQNASVTDKDGGKKDFDLKKALAQEKDEDKVLASGDTIYIRTNSGTFNIYGAVNRPGTYPIKQAIPLTDAIAMAGGYMASANIKHSNILRGSTQTSMPINIDAVEKKKAENLTVMAGDTIVVPQRGEKTSVWQVLSGLGNLGWLIWLGLIFLVSRLRHTTLDDVTPLTFGQRLLGACMLLVFVLVFMPIPWTIVQ